MQEIRSSNPPVVTGIFDPNISWAPHHRIIRYIIGVKRGVIYVISCNYAKIKVDLYDSLPLAGTVTFDNKL